jgi:hypothetical protein
MKGLSTKLLVIIAAWLLVLSLGTITHALSAEIIVDSNTLAVGESLQLQVKISGSASASPPQFKAGDGLQIVYRGPSTSVQIINGRMSATTTFIYSILGAKAGTYHLGPITVNAGGKQLKTNSVRLTVTPAAPAQPGQTEEETGPDDSLSGQLKKRLFLTLDLPRRDYFPGETVKTAIRLYVGGIKVQDVNYPTIKAADFCQVEIGKPVELSRNINGIPFKILEFPTTIGFAKTGEFTLGPATLHCNALVKRRSADSFFGDLFDDYEQYPQILSSQKLAVTVRPLPPRPDSFSGGIGQFDLKVKASPETVLAGDPITVQLTVTGPGNLAAIAPPALQNRTGLKIYAAQRKTSKKEVDSGNKAVFEQIIFPLNDRVTKIGPYSLTFFDPGQNSYRTVTVAAIPVKVKPNPNFNPAAGAGGSAASTREQLGQGLVYIKNSPGRLRLKADSITREPWFWLLQLLPLAAILGAFSYRRYHEFQNSDSPFSRALRANGKAGKQLKQAEQLLQKQSYDEYLDELHRIFREYLADKFQLAAGGITGAIVSELAAAGLEQTVLQNITQFFAQYDQYRFTGAKISKTDAERLQELVVNTLTALNNKKTGPLQATG